MPRWGRVLARGRHILVYVLMVGGPLLVGAAASAGEAPPVPRYGVVPAPNLPRPLSHGPSETLGNIHKLMVKSIYLILALHVLGALKHHLFDRDEVLHRMLPILPRR